MPKPASKKPTIAVDIDDVLVAEAEFIVDFSNKKWGHALSLDDYSENWSKMWKLTHQETEKRADVLHSPGMIKRYRHLEGSHEALRKLSEKFRLVILTSRRAMIKEETLEWLSDNFGDLFEEVHFTGFWDADKGNAHLLTKAELSRQIGADYLIDDQPRHCFAAAEAGVESILFGNYAESREMELPSGVTRCNDWQEVLEYFDGQS